MPLLRRFRFLLFLLFVPISLRAEPALWVVHSPTATVYLFGTVHRLKSDATWRSPHIDLALAESGDLWLEVKDPFDRAAVAPFVRQYALDVAHPLSSKLNDAERARLAATVSKAGLPGVAGLEPLRPWMVAMIISMSPITAAGFEPSSGVETILTAAMKDSGRPVYGLETIQQQLQFFATLTPKAELQMLDDAMDDVDDGVGKLQAVVSAWQAGDVEAIGKLLDEDIATKEPDAYKALIIDRNVAWTDRLVERLKDTGVSFVAVGAGHLAGPDSLQAQLARRGITVERQ
jgi:hypothetical protein